MSKYDISTAIKTVLGLALFGVVHYTVFYGLGLQEAFKTLDYCIEELYLLEFFFTVLVFGLMVGLRKKLTDNLGYLFLGIIALRLVASYLFARNGLSSALETSVFRYNLVAVVLIFLGGDTFIAYRILNNIEQFKKR